MDNHADTSVVSPHLALAIHDFETPVIISGYKPDVAQETCKTVTAVIAYDAYDGKTYYLIVHHALLVQDIANNLLCGMQLRDRGLGVNDEPKSMVPNPTDMHHAIHIPGNSQHGELIIPLTLRGVTHYFPT